MKTDFRKTCLQTGKFIDGEGYIAEVREADYFNPTGLKDKNRILYLHFIDEDAFHDWEKCIISHRNREIQEEQTGKIKSGYDVTAYMQRVVNCLQTLGGGTVDDIVKEMYSPPERHAGAFYQVRFGLKRLMTNLMVGKTGDKYRVLE